MQDKNKNLGKDTDRKSTFLEKQMAEQESNEKRRKKALKKCMTLVGLLTAILTAAAVVELPPAVAWICVIFFSVVILWQLVDWIGYNRLMRRTHIMAASVKRIFRHVCFFLVDSRKIVVAVVGIWILLCIVFWNFYHTSNYYREVTEIYGLPAGIGDTLSPSEREQLAGYWKITDYPLRRQMILAYIEPYGQLDLMQEYSSLYQMELFQPSAKIVYHYKKDEETRCPEEISYYNSSGKLLLRMEQKEEGSYEVVSCSEEDKPQLLNSTLFRVPEDQSEEKLMMVQMEVSYNDDGQPKMRKLESEIYSQYGINGERYDYDQNGRMTRLCYLDVNGKPICNKLGIMTIVFEYRKDGRLESIQYFSNEEGTEKTEGFWGVACERFDYYQNGNLKERRQEDRDGNWWYDTKNVYMYQYSYEKGRLEQEIYLGQGEVTTRENHFHSSSMNFAQSSFADKKVITVTLDLADGFWEEDISGLSASVLSGQQRVSSEQVIPTDVSAGQTEILGSAKENSAQPSLSETSENKGHARSYAVIRYVLNHKNHILEEGYYDREENPVLNDEGYSAKHFEYDSHLRIIDISYYDIDGRPCFIKGGYARIRNTYGPNQDDEIILEEYLDDHGKPATNREAGYAFVRYEYSDQADERIICKSFYDKDENPVCMKEYGCARILQAYDNRGFLVREEYQDEDGQPTVRTDCGIAQIRYDYEGNGDMIRKWYLDVNGQIANRPDVGYAALLQEYEDGRVIKKYYQGYEEQEWRAVPNRETGAASVKYTYEHGRIQKEEYFDAAGAPVLRSDTGYASVDYEYNDAGMISGYHYYGTTGDLILRKDRGYAVLELEYDDCRRCNAERYYGTRNHNPVISSKYHCAGFEYGYDDQGNKNVIRYMDLDGTPLVRDDLGYAEIHKEYDNQGNEIKIEYFDDKGNSATTKEGGYASYENIYEKGLWTESRYYDTQGNLTLQSAGYALIILEYDEYGQHKSEKYFGINEKPVISTKYHCAGHQYAYDEKGNLTDISYLGLDETFMVRSDLGYAHVRKEYDDRDHVIKETYYDTEEQPTVCKNGGYVSYTNVYDGEKWMESRYYDQEGKMTLRSDTGYAMITLTYNAYGDRMEEHYWGVMEEPVISTKYHCAARIWERDALGNVVDIYYKGLQEESIVNTEYGYAHAHMEYDEQGNKIGESYYDANENPTIEKKGGFASYTDRYKDGRWVEGRYYDEQHNLVLRKDQGYAVIKKEYNPYGQCIADAYYGTDEESIISTSNACARTEYQYDTKGNCTDTCYIGLDGTPMIRRDLGYARLHREYDEKGNNISGTYFGVNDELVYHKERGNVSYENIYENGKWLEERNYDEQHNLILRKDCGYAIVRLEYDAYGEEVAEYYYDTEEQPVISSKYYCAGRKYMHNESGEITNIQYFGLDEELINCSNLGYAELRREYDVFGNIIGEAYYDADGNPAIRKDVGYASYESIYKNGKWIESRYYDQSGNPIRRKDKGYALIRLEYNAYGQETVEYYYGTDEQLVMGTEFYCAGRSYEYNEKGETTKICFLGLDKAPINRRDQKYAEIQREYDVFGNMTKEAYFDAEEKPVTLSKEGYAFYVNTYTDGKCTQTEYFDGQGKPVMRKDYGYAVETRTYDTYGKCTEWFFGGRDGNPVLSTEYLCAGFRYAYDERGNRTDTWYCGEDKNPICRSDKGYAQIHSEYDSLDHETKVSYLGTDKEPAICEGGYASCFYVYKDNLCREIWYYDTQGDVVLRADEGYAVETIQYNEYGQKISQYYFDTEPKSVTNIKYHCEAWTYCYDDRGNDTYYWFCDANGDAKLREDIEAALYYKIFDACDHLVWEGYYDLDMNLVVRKDSDYAAISYTYDQNRLTEKKYLNEEQEPVFHEEDGYARIEYQYYDTGEMSAIIYRDEENELINNKDGYAKIQYEYDSAGNMVSWTYYNQDGKEIEM